MQDNEKKPALRFKGFTDPWEQRKLGEMMNVTSVKRIHQSDWVDSGIRFLRARDIVAAAKGEVPNDCLYISQEKYEEYSALSGKVDVGDMLVTGVGTIGIPYLVKNKEPLYFKDGNIIWFQNREKINGEFLLYTFLGKSVQNFISESAGIGTVGTYTIDSGKKTPVFLPENHEQERIGEFLKQLDTLITLHQRKYEKLVNIKKSMLDKMFPKNGASVPEIRFKGFTDPWEQRKLGEIAVRSPAMSDEEGLPRVEYEDIVSGAGRLNKDIKAKESAKAGIVFHKGDVLYGKLRPYLKNWLLASFNGLAVGDFWVLQPQDTDSSFLYRLVQSQQFDEVANQSTGTKMPRADWKLVSKTKFAVPKSVDEQAAIGAYFGYLDTLITLHQRKLEKLQNIKKSCLEKMFV